MSTEALAGGNTYALTFYVATINFDGQAAYARFARRGIIEAPDEGGFVSPDKPANIWFDDEVVLSGSLQYQIALPVTEVDGSSL